MKIKKINTAIFISLTLFLFPFFTTLARTFGDLLDDTNDLIASSLVRVIFALAMVYFLWGVVQYTLYPDGEKKDKGKSAMITGLIALTVMFSVYGLINIVMNTFGLNEDNDKISIPEFPE